MINTTTEEVAVMSDLVKRLRNCGARTDVEMHEDREEAADSIELLERDIELLKSVVIKQQDSKEEFKRQLTAEKALADRLYVALYFDCATDRQLAIRAYRKARGL